MKIPESLMLTWPLPSNDQMPVSVMTDSSDSPREGCSAGSVYRSVALENHMDGFVEREVAFQIIEVLCQDHGREHQADDE